MDREVGRLLAGLKRAPDVIAVVGDHGEMLGEHGEDGHGIFLYRASLEVPLILAGRGVAAGTHAAPSAPAAWPRRCSRLLGVTGRPRSRSAPPSARGEPRWRTARRDLPATAYGWSALRAVSDARLRFVAAPRPELYDFVADPGETKNLAAERMDDRRRLEAALAALATAARSAPRGGGEPEVAEALRSLGYHSGASGTRSGTIDPKDGIALLREFDQAKELRRVGRVREAVDAFEALVRKNPGNVPFLSRLAEAQKAHGPERRRHRHR